MSATTPATNSDSLPELLNGHCHVEDANGAAKLHYAKSDFTAADPNQVF